MAACSAASTGCPISAGSEVVGARSRAVLTFFPQAPGAGLRPLGSSRKLGRAVALAAPIRGGFFPFPLRRGHPSAWREPAGAGLLAPPWAPDCKSVTRSRGQPGARGRLSPAGPQAPGAGLRPLGSSHKLGRAVALAAPIRGGAGQALARCGNHLLRQKHNGILRRGGVYCGMAAGRCDAIERFPQTGMRGSVQRPAGMAPTDDMRMDTEQKKSGPVGDGLEYVGASPFHFPGLVRPPRTPPRRRMRS